MAVSVLFIGYYAFYFVAVSGINYFSNPQYIEIENEKTELKKIKDKYNITEIESFPMKKAEEKKPSITYKIYAYDTRYCTPDKIKLEKEAKAIFSEISFMKLPSNVNRYEIVFCCNLYTIPMEFHLNIINRKYQTDEKKIKTALIINSFGLFYLYLDKKE